MKKIVLNKKVKIISTILLFLVVISIVTFLCLNSLDKEEKPLSTYKMELNYNAEEKVLNGEEEITFINNYDNMFTYLYLHLYPNAFREGAINNVVSSSDEDSAYPNGKSYGDIEIISVTYGEEELNFTIEGEDKNILKIDLPFELFPDESITFNINYKVLEIEESIEV